MLHYWPVNLRVARKFTGVYPPKKLDLRVARKSTISPLPGDMSKYHSAGIWSMD